MKLNGKCFARPPKFRNRMIMMIIGIILQGFGLSLLRMINLGTDPCSTLTIGVTNYLPFSFGTCQLLCHLITFLVVLRFDLSKIGFGTIGNMVCLGYISDFFCWVWNHALPAGFFDSRVVDYIVLVPAFAVFITGAATYMTADLGMSPYDAVSFIIADHCPKISFKVIRMIWDISFMVVGFLLGGGIGIVTIAVAFFTGPIVSFIQKKLSRFITEPVT